MSNRESRHTRHEPTKEDFYAFVSLSGGATLTNLGGVAGVLVDADDEAAYIAFFIPRNFTKLKELKLVVIPVAAVAAMTLRIINNRGLRGELYTAHTKTVDKSFLAAMNAFTEIDISDLLDTLIVPLERNDYVGVQITRVAGQNTNALVLGVRMRYI